MIFSNHVIGAPNHLDLKYIFSSLQSCELMELVCLCVRPSVFSSADKSQKFSYAAFAANY